MEKHDNTVWGKRAFYIIAAILLFITELLIALFVHDDFIRPYAGDFLVVILLYCIIRSLFDVPAVPVAAGVLLFAFLMEYLQYLDIIKKLNLQNNRLARIVIGNSFSWHDLLAYIAGIVIVLIAERIRQ